MIQQYLYLRDTKAKGRGVFTKEKINAGVMVEESPVIVMSSNDRVYLDKTLLHDYIFEWGKDKDDPKTVKCCVALGLVSLYNHSYESNCEYFMDFDKEMIQIKTIRPVKRGEELTINYNGNWNDSKKVWFEDLSGS